MHLSRVRTARTWQPQKPRSDTGTGVEHVRKETHQ